MLMYFKFIYHNKDVKSSNKIVYPNENSKLDSTIHSNEHTLDVNPKIDSTIHSNEHTLDANPKIDSTIHSNEHTLDENKSEIVSVKQKHKIKNKPQTTGRLINKKDFFNSIDKILTSLSEAIKKYKIFSNFKQENVSDFESIFDDSFCEKSLNTLRKEMLLNSYRSLEDRVANLEKILSSSVLYPNNAVFLTPCDCRQRLKCERCKEYEFNYSKSLSSNKNTGVETCQKTEDNESICFLSKKEEIDVCLTDMPDHNIEPKDIDYDYKHNKGIQTEVSQNNTEIEQEVVVKQKVKTSLRSHVDNKQLLKKNREDHTSNIIDVNKGDCKKGSHDGHIASKRRFSNGFGIEKQVCLPKYLNSNYIKDSDVVNRNVIDTDYLEEEMEDLKYFILPAGVALIGSLFIHLYQ
ncbi:hypothetical protein CDIK_3461 [Cucumispora dikerogammari]|nr:hypothetical protein CDIK_3461 [Cucumispora dikerogammari]